MKSTYLKACLPLLSLSAFAQADQPTEPHYIEYHNRVILFNGCHEGYERIKPNAIYAGVEGYFVPILNKQRTNRLLDAQLRMGYNFFFNGRDHVTPFAGVGFIEDFFRRNRHTYHRSGIIYGNMGILFDHEFNTIFNLGTTLKFLVGGPISNKQHWGSVVVGTDIGLPITFRFGYKRHWDIRIEPFNIFLHGTDASQDYWGFRSTVAYRF